jgi:hypothetical protein
MLIIPDLEYDFYLQKEAQSYSSFGNLLETSVLIKDYLILAILGFVFVVIYGM